MQQTKDKKLKKGQASLNDMMEVIGPYLPKGRIVADNPKKDWRLSNENSNLSQKDSGIVYEKKT